MQTAMVYATSLKWQDVPTTACNYDADVTDNPEWCEYADAGYDCDGVCERCRRRWCMRRRRLYRRQRFLNYNVDATDSDFAMAMMRPAERCRRVCDDASACNYNADATDDDGSCASPTATIATVFA